MDLRELEDKIFTDMNDEDKKFLKHMVRENYRGIPTSDLVCTIQDKISEKEDAEPGSKFVLSCEIDHILNEFTRRDKLYNAGVTTSNKEIIKTIKDKIKVADIIEWYCRVLYTNKERMKFLCCLHNDTVPSGVIYVNENKWHCFGCNKGGDVLDAVCHYERVDLMLAIQKLATHIGLDLNQQPVGKRVRYD